MVVEFDRIRVLWPDHLGLARGKYLPARLADRGTNHCVSAFGLGYDRSMIPAPGSFLLEGLRDARATFDPDAVRPSWEDDRTGVVVAGLDMEGSPYTFSARWALQEAVSAWEARGARPKIGIELEAYVMEPVPGVAEDRPVGRAWRRWRTPRSMVYGTGVLADPAGVIDDIMDTAEVCGFRVESINAEFDESQFELTLEYDDALRAADDVFLFRLMAREVALSHGLDLTFLGKPFDGVAGNGLHVNLSAVDETGANLFADPSGSYGLSPLALASVAGLVSHHRAMAALCAPTVNSYRRLQPGEINGYWANWGLEHRGAANRIPTERGSATRVENRLSCGSANVHLAVATVLRAALLGVEGELEPPPPLLLDGFDAVDTEIHVADSLAQALDDLEADGALIAAVGRDVCDNFVANKRAEWDRYIDAVGEDRPGATVTEWELEQYLMYH